MTVGQALERAEELRPGCKVDSRTRQRWLCEEDGMLRALLFSGCGMRAGVERTEPGKSYLRYGRPG